MAVRVGSARIDERGKVSGGAAGDQTGSEVAGQNWYLHSKGWVVIRAKDASVREKIAAAMEAACANNNIGYDQGQRLTLFNAVKTLGYNPAKCTKKVETDCSALVRVCVHYAGITCGDFNTSTEKNVLVGTKKFDALTDSKYTTSSDYLLRGDILVTKTKGHTVVVLSNGTKAVVVPTTPAPAAKPATTTPAAPAVNYYPKYKGSSTSIVSALSEVGCKDTSKDFRKKIAKANNISNYSGTSDQNTKMLNLLKQGKLIKP